MMKMIKANGTRRFNGRLFKEVKIYFQNGGKIVDLDFYPVEKVENAFEILPYEVSKIEAMIDKYAWAIDNWEQEKAAEAKNARIKAFLGM